MSSSMPALPPLFAWVLTPVSIPSGESLQIAAPPYSNSVLLVVSIDVFASAPAEVDFSAKFSGLDFWTEVDTIATDTSYRWRGLITLEFGLQLFLDNTGGSGGVNAVVGAILTALPPGE